MKLRTLGDNFSMLSHSVLRASCYDASAEGYQQEASSIFLRPTDRKRFTKACRHFRVARQSFHEWKKACADKGEAGLINSKPCQRNPALRTPPAIEEKALHLRSTYHLGQTRISMVPGAITG